MAGRRPFLFAAGLLHQESEGYESEGNDECGDVTNQGAATLPEDTPSASATESEDSCSPHYPLPIGKAVGRLTKKDMAKVQVFGGDDYISVTPTQKSNSEFKKEVETIIADFRKMIEGHEDKLRSIVFAKKDFAIALVGQIDCRLGFTDGSAFLDIPAGALDADRTIYMYRLPEDTDVSGPHDKRMIFSYSPLICCGPDGLKFKENVTLNFEHWATLVDGQGDSDLVVFGRDNENFPWKDTTNVLIKGNRVEHRLSQFSDRCYGYEAAVDWRNWRTPGLQMCLMIAVSRVRRHHVELVLLRDDVSLINARRDNFIDVWEFAANEVHLIRGISIEPTEHVTYESGGGFRVNGPDDWNQRHFYSSTIRTSPTGRFELNLRQGNRHIAAVGISQQGDVDTDLEVDQSFQYTHQPVQAEPFGRTPIQCPEEARAFAEGHSLQTFHGSRLSREESGQEPDLPSVFSLGISRVGSHLPLAESGPSEEEGQGQKTEQDESLLAVGSDRVERQRTISSSSHHSDDAVEGEPIESAAGGAISKNVQHRKSWT